VLGAIFHFHMLVTVGIVLFAGVVFFQVVNLPVEFDASARAKQQLVALGIIDQQQLTHVSQVLNAAAWTYVAGTLQAVMMLLYLITRFGGGSSRD
jgi:Zn-dependent membrane protease YugP